MAEYRVYVIIDGKPRWIIKNENGEVINYNPSSKELKNAQTKSGWKKYTDEELLDYLEIFYEENGKVPTQEDFVKNMLYPGFATYQRRFGSWNNGLKLAGLDNRKKYDKNNKYNDKELLNFLNIFYEENGKVPARIYFVNNPSYPDYQNYIAHFGSWCNALKIVGLDLDTMVKRGVLKTQIQKGRWVEIIVRDHFEKNSIDLSGLNCRSVMDGICPNGQTYEVKSAKLLTNGKWIGWNFGTENRDKDDDKEAIEWYYFAAFNEDFIELWHVWRVPGEIVAKDSFRVGMYDGEFNVDNMNKYAITDKFKDIVSKNKK